MEAYGVLELLPRGLGNRGPASECAHTFPELSHVSSGDEVNVNALDDSSVQYSSALQPGQVSGAAYMSDAIGLAAGGRTVEGIISASRPVSATPNLGAISASTLFAFPPAESAGYVDSLLGDIRHDKQYCDVYR